MEESHTFDNISKGLMETKQKWGLTDCIATTDKAANECKAFTLLNWVRFGCYGHRIILVVRNALSCPEVSKIIAKGRTLVTFFHYWSAQVQTNVIVVWGQSWTQTDNGCHHEMKIYPCNAWTIMWAATSQHCSCQWPFHLKGCCHSNKEL